MEKPEGKTNRIDDSLIKSLMHVELYDHPVCRFELIETHISWVILTGTFVYKIKKPVNLGFLDFSSLEKRKTCCEEELRLNSRTAPGLYVGVVAIYGSPQNPDFSKHGDAIEYAVKLNEFAQADQLDQVLQNKQLSSDKIDAVANMIADFHSSVDIANQNSSYGNIHQVLMPLKENIDKIRQSIDDEDTQNILDEVDLWIRDNFDLLKPVFNKRKKHGFVRECHGDLHLRNLAWIKNKPVAFDCIEFNPFLRWIDVMNDVAFMVMDLQCRNQYQLSQRFLNLYLEKTGDYAGIKVFTYYLIYRALVRAKVSAIRLLQDDLSDIEKKNTAEDLHRYMQLCRTYIHKQKIKLIITHGLSGSGKTTTTLKAMQAMHAIRIRSDIERKRMFESGLNKSNRDAIDLYTEDYMDKVYERLEALSVTIIDSAYSVIVDATFLDKNKRDRFRNLAARKNCEFIILNFDIPHDVLRERVNSRKNDVSDADLSVLEMQLADYKPLDNSELAYCKTIDDNAQSEKTLIEYLRN